MSTQSDEALARARKHLRQAAIEALEAARALLDAALHSVGVREPASDSLAGEFRATLDELLAALRSNRTFPLPRAFASSLLSILEAEIARWEGISANDPSARPVLRALLAIRELLWEFGIRTDAAMPSDENEPREPDAHAAPPAPACGSDPEPSQPEPEPAPPRVQRFEVE